MQFLDVVGLAIIMFGWAVQLMYILRKEREVHPHFLAAYITGIVILIIANKDQGLNFSAILNIASAVLATLIYLKLRR